MADKQFPDEEELEDRQATGLYPVGRALRTTFDADNHETLGPDLTGLMLHLARIEPDTAAKVAKPRVPSLQPAAIAPAVSPAPAAEASAPRPSWWRRWLG